MKHSILACLVMIASSAFCATQTSKEYVDTKASNTLVTAKSYTDTKAAEVTALIPNTNDFLSASWTNGSVIVAGYGASASGGVNTVVGMGAKAEGVGATAYGEMCRAIGQHAIAWGSARALGDYCVAMGLDAEAAVAYSIAIGEQARAIQQYTYAIGSHAMASNYNAFVVGNQSKALGQDAMAVGNRAQALDYRTMAVGLDSSANGWNAMSVGSSSLAHGLSSFAAGTASLAYGTYATALGMMACASNSSAVAIGYNSKALHNSSMSLGANSKSTGYNSVALGSSTEANQSSVAIGPGAKASGQQSVAIGRDAKATHTAAVAIGPTAETTGDGTIRIAYNPSEIMLGFWQPKSLRAYLDEVTPTIDWGIASNIVRNAEFLPSKYYYVYRGTTNMTAKWQWSALGYNNRYSTTLSLLPANADSLVDLEIGDGAMISFESGGRLNVSNGGEMWVPDPNAITFGSGQNQTNFNDYVMSLAGGVRVETDPTVPSWAKATNKPTYNYSEIGGTFPGITTESDPTVPSWAKSSNKPSYTYVEIGAISASELIAALTISNATDFSQSNTNSIAYKSAHAGEGGDLPTPTQEQQTALSELGLVTTGGTGALLLALVVVVNKLRKRPYIKVIDGIPYACDDGQL